MAPKRYMLIKGSEDGRSITWLTDAELSDLLADPSQWGVADFRELDDDDLNSDPNYWPDKVAVLVSFEVVMPERGGWRLPAERPDPMPGWTRGPDTPITLGKVID